MASTASIIVPTRARAAYLDVALASLAGQAASAGADVVVADDGADADTRRVAERHGARYAAHPEPRGPNAARNTGIDAGGGELLVFVDDDVQAPPGWLDALLAAAGEHPDHEVFGGPIRARLEGPPRRTCGREPPPITTLDLGATDREAEFVWGANMAIRRAAIDRVGPFDADRDHYGDEEEWLHRLRAAGGRVLYVAGAGLDHRRAAADATLQALSRAAYRRGRNARRYDVHKGEAPPLAGELRALAGCGWHTVRRRCANGPVLAAEVAGRVVETLRPVPAGGPDFLSGHGGELSPKRSLLAAGADAVLDAGAIAGSARLARAARAAPRRRILVLGVDRELPGGLMDSAVAELRRSHHDIELALVSGTGGRGKFENLNSLLGDHSASGHDWLLVLDDDVVLPPRFLDVFLFLAERFELRLAQPAHRRRSHAAWPVTRRRGGSLVRETAYVEIGPVTAFHAETFSALLPFPDLRMGWGLDVHWAALARERGWRIGVVDAVPIAHAQHPPAATYSREEAVAEAREFLAERPYLPRNEAARTLVTHRTWR